MSDLLNSASLVLIPSGYKEDVVYSAVPTDGSGDLSFTRASNGTRVNSAGLVEVVAWNLAEYSEDLSNGYWQKNNVTISSNTTVAPNGTTTADTFTNSSTGYGIFAIIDIVPSQQYTFSFYIKKGTNTSYVLSIIDNSTFASLASLDYSSQVSATDWVRITQTFTTPSTPTQIRVYQMRDGSTTGTAFLWGAQLNIGSTAKPYFPTTDRLNVPRLTYQNGGGGCPSLLLEKQSTNIVTYSEDLTNWILANSTVTANATTSPDGTINADKLIINNGAAGGYAYQIKSTSSGTVYTGSFYIKAGGVNYTKFYTNISGSYEDAVVNLSTGAITNSTFAITPTTQNMGNGWYRVNYTTTSASGQVVIYIDGGSTSNGGGYTGNGVDGVFVWGGQLEASSYPTSYIPTTSASATRVADACFKTGISSLIGQSEGTFFIELKNWKIALDTFFISLSDQTTSNYLQISANGSTGDLQSVIFTAGSPSTLGGMTPTIGQNLKIAVAYKVNNYALYVNGTQIGTLTSKPAPSSLTRIDVGSVDWLASNVQPLTPISQVAVFKTRLTNAELASLTTL